MCNHSYTVRSAARSSSRAICLIVALGFARQIGFAAIPISTTAPYTQNFDAMGTSATATLPADFRVDNPSTVRSVGTFTAAAATTVRVGGANLGTTAANGIYN